MGLYSESDGQDGVQFYLDGLDYECLLTTRFSVLINSNLSSNYEIGRGVRQGDLLSRFLFLIAVKGLKCLLEKASSLCVIEAISLNNLDLGLNFTDDTLILYLLTWRWF